MPVAHGHETLGINPLIAQLTLQRTCLALRMTADRRASTDGRIVMLYFSSTGRRNKLCQRLTTDASERKVNNVGVAEEVVKKRFDRFQRVGSTELKENYPHTPCCARHFPRIPRTQAMYSESSVRVN